MFPKIEKGKDKLITALILVIVIGFIIILIQDNRKRGANTERRVDSSGQIIPQATANITNIKTYETTAGDKQVSVTYPETSVGAINKDLERSITEFVNQNAASFSDSSLKGNHKTYDAPGTQIFNVVVEMRDSGQSQQAILTKSYSAGKPLTAKQVFAGEKLQKASAYLKGELAKRFPNVEVATIASLTEANVDNFQNFRVADNGVVVMFDNSILLGRSGYHEVLVPTSVIGEL